MQLYVVTWKFETSEYQLFASEALAEHSDGINSTDSCPGYERIAWIHTPQDGTGTVICKAENASVLYKVFAPWQNKYGMSWEYKPGLLTEELLDLLEKSS